MSVQVIPEVQEDNKTAEGWLLEYEERKAAYLQERQRVLEANLGRAFGTVAGAGSPGDPTGQKAVKLLELVWWGRWLSLVEEVEANLPPRWQTFLRLRRGYREYRGRRGWTAQMQLDYFEATGEWIESRETFSRWWGKIVDYTVRMAAKRGLLR